MQNPPLPPKKYGMAAIANDKIIDWLLPFLESYLATNAATPLYLIPYDENVALTRRAAEIYGVHFVEPDSAELDALAKRLYPMFPAHRRRLRKFLSLALPLDEVIYLDADVILFRDFSEMFGRIEAGKNDFIVAAQTADYVYNKNRGQYDFLRDAMLFNDGFFVASPAILGLKDFLEVIEKDEAIFHAVRQRGMLFAQPLTNFVVHRLGLRITPLYKCIPGASGESFYKAEGVTFDDEGPRDCLGGKIYFAHWAGAVTLPSRRVFDTAWRQFAAEAAARMKM
ncbi:MAG: glycosyltransferase [Beijerinckiaceae bacterium]|nr:glycosyltransferase [Beijerinckiaceae bacterium]